MSVKPRDLPRQLKPELEHDVARSPALGYERSDEVGMIRCLSHGYPTPLARWHYHDEYELHIITATSGKVFVGDWIGQFQAGQVVLTGPRLPHNWVSTGVLPEGGVPLRDLVIQFPGEPLQRAAEHIPELTALAPLLERARHGIEFFGVSDAAQRHWQAVKRVRGLQRLSAFTAFMADLAACTDYRLLSSVQLQSTENDDELDRIESVVSLIMERMGEPLVATDLARDLGMSESQFSRFFRKTTGNTFTDFVNRVRINRACQLLMETDRLITDICYEVGFHNVANFNRRFLDIKGFTPSEFRRQAAARFRGAA